ncbi:unnamed protein product [Closterium sp. Naga37s-1]|nr:unnamed protein product [Closterium sp. Naga37s-1]
MPSGGNDLFLEIASQDLRASGNHTSDLRRREGQVGLEEENERPHFVVDAVADEPRAGENHASAFFLGNIEMLQEREQRAELLLDAAHEDPGKMRDRAAEVPRGEPHSAADFGDAVREELRAAAEERRRSGGRALAEKSAVSKASRVRADAGDAAAAQTAEAAQATSRMMEVDKDSFYPELEKAAAADKLVVLDMYTQWCGPCKLLAPKVEALAEEMQDVVFLKLDCNQNNKVSRVTVTGGMEFTKLDLQPEPEGVVLITCHVYFYPLVLREQPLAKGLGVRSVPTFKLFRNLAQIDEVQGAKYDLLLEKITKHR